MDTLDFRGAAPGFSHHPDPVRVIHEENLSELVGQFYQGRKRCKVAFHAEHPVGGHESEAIVVLAGIRLEHLSQVFRVRVGIYLAVDDFGPA